MTRAQRAHNATRRRRRSVGQSLIEACLVIALICVIFMGMFQVSQLAMAREVLNHAAARGARARAVGFNDFMVRKSVRVAAIPNAGPITEPLFVKQDPGLRNRVATLRPGELWDDTLTRAPFSDQAELEKSRIPEYLGAENWAQAEWLLDYEDWDTVNAVQAQTVGSPGGGAVVQFRVWQDYPLWVPFHRAFYDGDEIRLQGRSDLEQHYPLYLEDLGW